MQSYQPSQFKRVSMGFVTQNKSRTTNDVEVYLSELQPFVNGEITDRQEVKKVTCVDPSGAAVEITVKTSNSVLAKWLGDSTNRQTAPDVRRGNPVEIYQYGDTDEYWWRDISDPTRNVKRRETVVHAFSNTVDENVTQLDASNSWIKEVNTHDKVITFIKTNKSDGEKHAWTVQLDVKGSNYVIADDVGNYIQVNSNEQSIELVNSAGTRVELNKDTVTINCKVFNLTAEKSNITVSETTWKGGLNYTGTATFGSGTYTFNGNVITNQGLTNKGKDVGGTHVHGNSPPPN